MGGKGHKKRITKKRLCSGYNGFNFKKRGAALHKIIFYVSGRNCRIYVEINIENKIFVARGASHEAERGSIPTLEPVRIIPA